MKTQHSISVACSPSRAFEAGLRVEQWPEIFPPCIAAEVLLETHDEQRIALTARANDSLLKWESTRQIDREKRTIAFVQSRPSPLVAYMNGCWKFEKSDEGTYVSLYHEYEIKDEVAGHVPGVASHEDAARFMELAVEDNSRRELEALRKHLERDLWLHSFKEELTLPFGKAVVKSLLEDISAWPWLMPHCLGIDVFYNDGEFQEFVMTVRVGDAEERIRSIRVLSDSKIEYFQPTPPPVLKEHRGRWIFEDVEEGVKVTSWHEVVLSPEHWAGVDIEEAKSRVATAINRNSLATMNAIATKLAAVPNA